MTFYVYYILYLKRFADQDWESAVFIAGSHIRPDNATPVSYMCIDLHDGMSCER
jgi:hypothetical protein